MQCAISCRVPLSPGFGYSTNNNGYHVFGGGSGDGACGSIGSEVGGSVGGGDGSRGGAGYSACSAVQPRLWQGWWPNEKAPGHARQHGPRVNRARRVQPGVQQPPAAVSVGSMVAGCWWCGSCGCRGVIAVALVGGVGVGRVGGVGAAARALCSRAGLGPLQPRTVRMRQWRAVVQWRIRILRRVLVGAVVVRLHDLEPIASWAHASCGSRGISHLRHPGGACARGSYSRKS